MNDNGQSIVISGGRVIDPASQLDTQQNVYIQNGTIQAIAASAPAGFKAGIEIDAKGHIVCPGFTELSARLREPGQEHKATIASESTAALHAGFTSLCIPPDTDPIIDEPSVVELIQKRAQQVHGPHILPLGALTSRLAGQQLSEMAALKQTGCVGVSNALYPMQDHRVLRRAMEYAATYDLTIHVIPLDAALANNGVAHEGATATRLGLTGIPATAETIAIALYLALAADTGARLHFGRITTAQGAAMIGEGKLRKLPVTADVAIHHLHLTDKAIDGFNSQAHVIPPLRSETDRKGLLQAVADGVIDAICCDHQPHEKDAKLNPYPVTAAGISGLDTLLGLTLTLVESENITLMRAIDTISYSPAKIVNSASGRLSPGAPADICIFNPQTGYKVDSEKFLSAGKNTPFNGWQLSGKVLQTLINGQLMLAD